MKKRVKDDSSPPLLDWFDQVSPSVDNERLTGNVMRKIRGINSADKEATQFWYGGLTLLIIINIFMVLMFFKQVDTNSEIVYQREDFKEISNQFLMIAQVP